MSAYYQQGRIVLYHGGALATLQGLPENSLDSLVTDPPAGIDFMGRDWDNPATFPLRGRRDTDLDTDAVRKFGNDVEYDRSPKARRAFIAFLTDIFSEALRVCKPGAHALVWALPRTSHWTATALEDAGWEIRDCCYHLFATGFPKSKNLGNGQGTALKPAVECWWLARKPLSEPNIAANVARWGTGGLNIDASRVEHLPGEDYERTDSDPTEADGQVYGFAGYEALHKRGGGHSAGRWPPHLLLSHAPECRAVGTRRVKGTNPPGPKGFTGALVAVSAVAATGNHPTTYTDADGYETVDAWECVPGCPVAELDAQSGVRITGNQVTRSNSGFMARHDGREGAAYTDTGGASRFYPIFHPDPPFRFVAKPAQTERNQGCEALPAKSAGAATGRTDGSAGLQSPRAGAGRTSGARNHHPTVKSLELMRWLCRLVTPPGGTVLDCFGGSGSTIIAADQCGYGAVYIDQDADYCAIAQARLVGDAPLLALLPTGGAA